MSFWRKQNQQNAQPSNEPLAFSQNSLKFNGTFDGFAVSDDELNWHKGGTKATEEMGRLVKKGGSLGDFVKQF